MRFTIAIVLLLGACDEPPPPAGTPPTVASTTPMLGPGVRISMDGTPVATLPGALSETPLRMLIPQDPSTWATVRVEAKGNRHFQIDQPAKQHADARFEATVTNGKLTVNFRKPLNETLPEAVRAAARRPIATLDDVTAIRITSQERAAATAPRAPVIVVEVDGAKHEIRDLTKLKEISLRHGKEQGYELASIIAQHAAIARVKEVTVLGLDDERQQIAGSLLTDATQILIVRVNRNGALRFRHYAQPQADAGTDRRSRKPKMLHRVRDVQSVVVTTK